MEMSTRRAANHIARGFAGSRRIVVIRRRKGAGRDKAIPKMMKRSAGLAERARPPEVQPASWFDWEKWPGYVLLAYTIAWFAFVSSFIAN
jgi:hypothetical protein